MPKNYSSHPTTPSKPGTYTIAGRTFTDDYLWLEDRKSEDVKEWAHAQTVHTDEALRKNGSLIAWQESLSKAYPKAWRSAPIKAGGRLFYREQLDDAPMPTLYVEEDGERRALIAPRDPALRGRASLETWEPSPDGKLLAYVTATPDEIQTLRIRDIASNQDTAYTVEGVWNDPVWTDDGTGLYYIRRGKEPTGPDSVRQWQKVCFHRLGASPADDTLIFDPGGKNDFLSLAYDHGAPGIVIHRAVGWSANDVFYYDFRAKTIQDVFVGHENDYFHVQPLADRLVVLAKNTPEHGRLFTIGYAEIGRDPSSYADVIPASDRFMVSYRLSKSYLFVTYRKDMANEVEIYDRSFVHVRTMPIPSYTTCYISTDLTSDVAYVSTSGLRDPGTTYRYDPVRDRRSVWYETPRIFKPDDFDIVTEWISTPDGEHVPVLVLRKAGVSGPRPLILYGYGGFNDVQEVFYVSAALAWCEKGGSFAWAVLRGDGNYGRKWYDDGRRRHKQTTFDDFAACAEALVAKGYTTPDMLGLHGGSNGGLTVAAVSVQHPRLARAVAADVPLLDMVRYADFLIAGTWTVEYGDPHVAEELEYIRSWSPYQNIAEDVRYPAFYISAAEHDSRVHPMHAYKMAAKLQALPQASLTLLDAIDDVGHLGSNDRFAAIRNAARRYAFFAWQLGLNDKIAGS